MTAARSAVSGGATPGRARSNDHGSKIRELKSQIMLSSLEFCISENYCMQVATLD